MSKEKYRSVIWFNLLKDFGISFCVGALTSLIIKDEFGGVQIIYVCLLICTMKSTVKIFKSMQAGVEDGLCFLPLSGIHKIILVCVFMMGIASISIIPMEINGSENPYSVVILLIILLVGIHYLSKWWEHKEKEINSNRIQRYILEENVQIQQIVDHLIVHASDEMLFEILKDRVCYNCVYDENFRIENCKTLYLCDLGIAELSEPLRLSAYKAECKTRYFNQKYG